MALLGNAGITRPRPCALHWENPEESCAVCQRWVLAMDALAAARKGAGTSPQSSGPHAPAAPPPRQEQRGVVALPPSSVCCATSLKPVTELWPAGTSEEVMIHAIGSILLRFESMLQTEIHHDFWVQNPWKGVFDCLLRRLLWNAARTRKRTSSYSAMIDPGRFMHFDHDRRRLAERFHYVPVLVWSDGSCQTEISSGMGPNGVGHGCQWWPMVINPWTPAWNIFGQIDPNLFWGMCPALAINGGRPWPVHASRVRVLTNRILAGKPEAEYSSDTAGTSTAAPSEVGSSWQVTDASSEIGSSWQAMTDASSEIGSSWQAVTDASPDRQSGLEFL